MAQSPAQSNAPEDADDYLTSTTPDTNSVALLEARDGEVEEGGEVRPHSADLEPPAEADEPTGPACPHCGAANQDTQNSWCTECGFYGKLGTCLELTDWDRPQPEATDETQFASDPTYLDVLKMVPGWGWVLLAGVVSILLVSALVRLAFPAPGGLRMAFSLTELVIGALALFIAHLITYVRAAAEDSRIALMDFMMRPISLWGHAVRELPSTRHRLQSAVCGLVAVVASLLIVGGLPWHMLWEWGIEERAKPNLVSAVTSLAGESDMDMEEALNEFAGTATRGIPTDEEEVKGAPGVPDVLKPRNEQIDCLILGYYPKSDSDGDFAALLLAAEVDGQLVSVGTVSDGIPEEVRAELIERFPALTRATPFVRSNAQATWLAPRLTCRVRFSEWSRAKKLENPLFEKMLAEIDL